MTNRWSREKTSVRGDNSRHSGYVRHVFVHSSQQTIYAAHDSPRLPVETDQTET